ncbi:MAG: aldo/keto reductase [Planctomycetota bacterium]
MEKPTDLLLNDGNTIPQFGLGMWQVPDDQAQRVALEALEIGYRHIDTAQVYDNEAGVGRALRTTSVPREELFVTSKCRNKLQGYDSTIAGFEESMEKLGLDTLDLFLIHWPFPEADRYVDTWRALIDLKERGRVKSIGVSNFKSEHLQRLIDETGVTPAINQVELHPRFQQVELRQEHARLGIITQAWSPLGRAQTFDEPVLQAIAKNHGKSPAQVILRWHLDCGLVTFPKSVHRERLVENFDLFDFQLSPEEMEQIATLDRADGRIGPDPAVMNVAF